MKKKSKFYFGKSHSIFLYLFFLFFIPPSSSFPHEWVCLWKFILASDSTKKTRQNYFVCWTKKKVVKVIVLRKLIDALSSCHVSLILIHFFSPDTDNWQTRADCAFVLLKLNNKSCLRKKRNVGTATATQLSTSDSQKWKHLKGFSHFLSVQD